MPHREVFSNCGPMETGSRRTAGPLPWQMLFVWILNALQRTGAKGLVASLWHCREVLEPTGGCGGVSYLLLDLLPSSVNGESDRARFIGLLWRVFLYSVIE